MWISIPAWKNKKYFTLFQILSDTGHVVDSLQWMLRIDELAPGPDTEKFLQTEGLIDAKVLFELALLDVQIIDGELIGQTENGDVVLTIRAVDSTSWEVQTEIVDVTQKLLSMHPSAQEIDE